MDRHFCCTTRFAKAVRKAKHKQVAHECETVKQTLALYPDHGSVHDRFNSLRKMRVFVSGCGFGSRGGYRAIYRAVRDEDDPSSWKVVFLDLYLKADVPELPDKRYERLEDEARKALAESMEVEWATVSVP